MINWTTTTALLRSGYRLVPTGQQFAPYRVHGKRGGEYLICKRVGPYNEPVGPTFILNQRTFRAARLLGCTTVRIDHDRRKES